MLAIITLFLASITLRSAKVLRMKIAVTIALLLLFIQVRYCGLLNILMSNDRLLLLCLLSVVEPKRLEITATLSSTLMPQCLHNVRIHVLTQEMTRKDPCTALL